MSKIIFQFKANDLTCTITQGSNKFYQGYVGVPIGHPAYGLEYDEVDAQVKRVHGGLSYSDYRFEDCADWHFGFDCGHLKDKFPGNDPTWLKNFFAEVGLGSLGLKAPEQVERDLAYVIDSCQNLAECLTQFAGTTKEGQSRKFLLPS